jgi:hypothetical protein
MRKEIFAAGLVVARRQLIGVTMISILVLSLQPLIPRSADDSLALEGTSASNHVAMSVSPETMMAAAFLLVAVGLIATSEAELMSTAGVIKKAARIRNPTNPESVIEQLIAMTGMAALGSAAMAFSDPLAGFAPSYTDTANVSVPGIVWSSCFSVTFAFFAATARAGLISRRMP